ncbi:Uncharacterised protein [Mycobacteroides abscessus]|nr:Uncharacterised protein [Mycobacteroides abscessus]
MTGLSRSEIASLMISAVPATFGPNNWLYGSTWFTKAPECTIRSTSLASFCQTSWDRPRS